MKKFILGIIVGGIIFGTSIYAATTYYYAANEVSYIPSDSTWNVTTVKAALDNLKSTSGTALTDLKNISIAKAVSANGDSLSSVINTLGTITNQGNKSFIISSTGSTTIPAGYYNGTGKITTSGLVKPSGTKSITSNGTYNVSGYESAIVNIPKSSLEGDVKVVQDCVDRWHSSWITVDSWSKYRGFVVVAYAGNGVGGISYGTIDSNGGITYTSKSSYTSVEVSGNKIRGGEGIMSNVGVFLMIY